MQELTDVIRSLTMEMLLERVEFSSSWTSMGTPPYDQSRSTLSSAFEKASCSTTAERFHSQVAKDMTERGNDNGISLVVHVEKILLKIFAHYLSYYSQCVGILPEEQRAFRSNHFTATKMYAIH